MSRVPTVEVVDGDEFRVINESDFDPKFHTRLQGQEGPAGTAATADAGYHKGLPTKSSTYV